MRFLALILLVLAGEAGAGAWPRDKGHGFASASFRLSSDPAWIGIVPPSHYSTFYLEYGVTDRLTGGLDLGRSVAGEGKTIAYARLPLGRPETPNKFAFELGAGLQSGDAVLRPGLSYGRGFATRLGDAWIAVDGVAEYHVARGYADYKIDATFGITHPRGRKTLFQLQTGAPRGDPAFVRLATSTVIPIGGRRHLELGVVEGLAGPAHVGVMIGLWQDF